jgi:hypothetical protein
MRFFEAVFERILYTPAVVQRVDKLLSAIEKPDIKPAKYGFFTPKREQIKDRIKSLKEQHESLKNTEHENGGAQPPPGKKI